MARLGKLSTATVASAAAVFLRPPCFLQRVRLNAASAASGSARRPPTSAAYLSTSASSARSYCPKRPRPRPHLDRQLHSAATGSAQPGAPEPASAGEGARAVSSIELRPDPEAVYLATMLKNKACAPPYKEGAEIPKEWAPLTFAEKDRLLTVRVPKDTLRQAARIREAVGVARRAVRKVTARYTPDYFEETGHPESFIATMLTRENVDSYSQRVLKINPPKVGFSAEHQAPGAEGTPKPVENTESSRPEPVAGRSRPPLFLRSLSVDDCARTPNSDFVNPAFKPDRLPLRGGISPEEADIVFRQLPLAEVEAAKADGALDVSEEELLRRKLRKAEMVARIVSLYLSEDSDIDAANRKKIQWMFGNDEHDTSSLAVRIAMLTLRIIRLREYMADGKNRKDQKTKVNLGVALNRRQKMCRQYKAISHIKYYDLLHRIGLKEVRYLGYASSPAHNRRSM